MTFDRRNYRTNWVNAGNLGGHASRTATIPVNTNSSEYSGKNKNTNVGTFKIPAEKPASKFLTLYDVY